MSYARDDLCRVVLDTSEPRDWEVHRWVLEARKKVRRVVTREQRLAEEQRHFEIRREKREKKHRGH